MKKSTIIIIGGGVLIGISSLLYVAYLKSKKILDILTYQQNQISTTTVPESKEGAQSIDDIIKGLPDKVLWNKVQSLREGIEREKEKGKHWKVIRYTYDLAQILSGIGNEECYKESINTYKKVIDLATEPPINKNLIDDSYYEIGNIYMNPKCFDLKNAIFAYLNGILQEGDMKETIVTKMKRLREDYKANVTMPFKEFYDQADPPQKRILREAFPEYSAIWSISKKHENRRNWKYAQEYTNQTMNHLRTQNVISLRARTQNTRRLRA